MSVCKTLQVFPFLCEHKYAFRWRWRCLCFSGKSNLSAFLTWLMWPREWQEWARCYTRSVTETWVRVEFCQRQLHVQWGNLFPRTAAGVLVITHVQVQVPVGLRLVRASDIVADSPRTSSSGLYPFLSRGQTRIGSAEKWASRTHRRWSHIVFMSQLFRQLSPCFPLGASKNKEEEEGNENEEGGGGREGGARIHLCQKLPEKVFKCH